MVTINIFNSGEQVVASQSSEGSKERFDVPSPVSFGLTDFGSEVSETPAPAVEATGVEGIGDEFSPSPILSNDAFMAIGIVPTPTFVPGDSDGGSEEVAPVGGKSLGRRK
jgi:hypothetical protein